MWHSITRHREFLYTSGTNTQKIIKKVTRQSAKKEKITHKIGIFWTKDEGPPHHRYVFNVLPEEEIDCIIVITKTNQRIEVLFFELVATTGHKIKNIFVNYELRSHRSKNKLLRNYRNLTHYYTPSYSMHFPIKRWWSQTIPPNLTITATIFYVKHHRRQVWILAVAAAAKSPVAASEYAVTTIIAIVWYKVSVLIKITITEYYYSRILLLFL